MTAPPVLFAFGLHLHQPVGNFDSVFVQHLADVYEPLIAALDRGGAWPVTFHVSGPLLDWLEAHAPAYLDRLGAHVAAGRIELLLAGYDEPILAVLSRDDRIEQVARMREALRRRFGVTASGLWLTERVWEPDLVVDLAAAGVGYVVVDDRHFLVAGAERATLHRPFRTESGGASLAVFPIDERLRYLVPFRPPAEIAGYFRELRAAGAPLAVLADDGEKFGGWPGTLEWVYGSGWMTEFTDTLRALSEAGEIRLVTFAEALAAVPSGGLTYLPSASYREMEGWSLPTAASLRLAGLEKSLGAERMAGPDGALVRGTHWRNFLVKYPESNRMHKKMVTLSALSRARGDAPAIRRAIGRAQCNDAYWHGVFGGLYLPHLRQGVWSQLALAEGLLRQGEAVAAETIDLDRDGLDEIWIHGERFSAIVSPARGGAIEEWTLLGPRDPARGTPNAADTLTRRREPYHEEAIERASRAADGHGDPGTGTASIHDLEERLKLDAMPPFDRYTRAIAQERATGTIADAVALQDGLVVGLKDFGTLEFVGRAVVVGSGAVVSLAADGLSKRIIFRDTGAIEIEFAWTPVPGAVWFTTELSLATPVTMTTDAAQEWRYGIETVAKSEKGFDRTVQGTAVVLGWPNDAGKGRVALEIG